eukprot:SAG31_NODE_9221_length_1314_cov_1.274074_2_plen_222_part_00
MQRPRSAPTLGRCGASRLATAAAAQELCGDLPVPDALQAVGMSRRGSAEAAVLMRAAALRIKTALDLRLLDAAGVEADELFEALKTGGVPVADRGKIRLLVGETVGSSTSVLAPAAAARPVQSNDAVRLRQLQAGDEADGLSNDTLAIIFSVALGCAGYVLQVCSPQAPRHCLTVTLRGILTLCMVFVHFCMVLCASLQAFSARRAETAAREQAQEQNFAE